MNLHMPQDIESESELRNLAAIPWQIVSPGNNKPIVGIFQDSLLGSYRLTRENVNFTARQAMNLLMAFKNVDITKLPEHDNISSFELLSQILPPLSIKYKTKQFKDGEDAKTSNSVLQIENGKYIRGQLEKGVLGDGSKGLLHRVCNDFGNMQAAAFIDDLQNIVTEYMKSSAYSVGISDLIADDETNEKITKIISEKKKEVQNLIDQTHLGIFENKTGKTDEEEFETQVTNVLSKALNQAGKTGLNSLSKDNRFVIMVKAGSKGGEINISQMISCLGQQQVDGKRVPYGFENRTLPHFSKYDDTPSARGFVENSFISGLSPQELFFHAMGGRIGLIDTAVKSVSWDTPIVIIENNNPQYIPIGKWVDLNLDNPNNKENVQHIQKDNMELLNVSGTFIPTTDMKGNVTWEEITAVTRHDPGDKLYKIITQSGRDVIVTASKSLIVWDATQQEFVEKYTNEITTNDFVPVNAELTNPNIKELNEIDMEKYFPKTEYVYGCEYNKAVKLMNNEMVGRTKIPSNWWSMNNNNEFVLPYTKKSSLQRSTQRNISTLANDRIYPYHASRENSGISNTFKLNKENGIFIGLYIAEGNIHNGKVCITNNDETIIEFVKAWFDKQGIYNIISTKTSNKGYKTTTVIGYSTLMSVFIKKMIGHLAHNKRIPPEAFISNKEFIIGLLDGYFSGDGSISRNSIDACSASKELINSISMLCARLNIFTKLSVSKLKHNNFGTKNIKPSYRLSIRSKWGDEFKRNISLTHPEKQRKLSSISFKLDSIHYKQINNIVLDKIIEIQDVSPELHPKMYDLTIPKTLNFGLANGLQVRDTSQTGYIQRRLIKGLEDIKIEYDMTVRNNKRKIIQFTYGDDSFDTVKVEAQILPIAEMTLEDIYSHFQMPSQDSKDTTFTSTYISPVIKRIKSQHAQLVEKSKEMIEFFVNARENVIKYVFKQRDNKTVNLPVAFNYIINNIQGQLYINANSMVDITPLEAYEIIDDGFSQLQSIHYAQPTELFKITYYYYMSPKQLLMFKRFNRKALILLVENIIKSYKQSIVAPGEMVGLIAAQSIGEPTTQLTLNSFVYETEILIRDSYKNIQKIQMGDFVNKLIVYGNDNKTKMEYYPDKDTTYAPTLDNEYWEIQAPDEDGNVDWYKIEAGTRHPVINEDGTNTMLKVITEDEQEVIATKAKSFLMLKDGKLVATRGDELSIGDYVPVSTKMIDHESIRLLQLQDILPPTEYLYGSEAFKAMNYWNEHQWWHKYHTKEFTLPYKRSDAFRDRMKEMRKGCENRVQIENGCVYPKKTWKNSCSLPESIPLDYDFGFLIGAYCAEGCLTRTQISIANNDFDYHTPIQRWCDKYNITTKQYKHENKGKEGWTSSDIRIYSIVLTDLLEKLCGKLSHNKFIHQKLIFSNDEFKKGFINGYIGGDGSVDISSKSISSYSVSYQLLSDFNVMLKTLGIYSYIRKRKLQRSNNRGTKPENIHQGFSIIIRNSSMIKLAKYLENNEINYKAENARKLMEYSPRTVYNKHDECIPNIVNGVVVMEQREDKMKDVVFVKIKSIEEVPNTTEYAYDLTVEKTRNFVMINGLNLLDTFHFAGVASKSNVTRGVPRIEEILSLSENPKNPSCTIHLRPEEELDQENAQKIMLRIEHTKLREVVDSIEICFDPADGETVLDSDVKLMEQYKEFETMLNGCLNEEQETDEEKSKWIIRMELNVEEMLDKGLTMDDIHFAIKNAYKDQVSCVFSDYNDDKLVFRLRLNQVIKKKSVKKYDPLDQQDEIYLLKNFQDELLDNLVLRGVQGMQKLIPRKITDSLILSDGSYQRKETWVLDSVGTNLLDLLSLDYIDVDRTYTNDIQEIYRVLGIEAARQAIFNELSEVIEFDNTYINYHHLTILCDRMTCSDKMISIFRHGINNDDIGPIAKASFEETPEMFLKAARHAELDPMRGVSANVMCGQEGYFGTGAFQLVLDVDEMSKVKAKDFELVDVDRQIQEGFEGLVETDDPCAVTNFTTQSNIHNVVISDMGDLDDYNPGF